MSWDFSKFSSEKIKNIMNVSIISVDRENNSAECLGSKGKVYKTTLHNCTCMSFSMHKRVCKHMLRLAMVLENEVFPSFAIIHRQYGALKWYIVDIAPSTLTILSEPLPVPVAFYDPKSHTKAHYIRIDNSASRATENCGTLYEVQNPPLSEEKSNENAQRYNDIMEYGSNQWVVSDIRKMLNGEFIKGLPLDFVERIIPQKHDIIFSKTACSKESDRDNSSIQIGSTGDLFYDSYIGNNRITHGVATDYIYLPEEKGIRVLHEAIRSCPEFKQPRNYWLMDAAYESATPYLVKAVSACRDLLGETKVYSTTNNARYPLYICPMCVISTKQQ